MSMLERRAVTAQLLRNRGEALLVTGLGSPTYDAFAVADSPLNFYLWGAMGSASMVGLGLAGAQPGRRVVVVTGDGEMLMGLGALATIAVQQPRNLAIVVLDNERYGETGMQASHTAFGVDLAAVAKACGFVSATMVTTIEQVSRLRADLHRAEGPLFAQVKVAPDKLQLVLPPRDGAHLKDRFREALLGKDAYFQR